MIMRNICSKKLEIALVAVIFSAVAAQAQTVTKRITGKLEDGDKTFEDGAPYDAYSVGLREFQSFKAKITSAAIDFELIKVGPDGNFQSTAKGEKGATNIGIETRALKGQAGEYQILVSGVNPGVTGSYTLELVSTEQILNSATGPDGKPIAATVSNTPNGQGEGDKSESLTVVLDDVGEISLPLSAFVDRGAQRSFGKKEPIDGKDLAFAIGLPDQKQYVLGKGGHAVWEFTDNVLLDGEGPDLLIWQADGNESFEVWVSPDGRGYQIIDECSGDGIIAVDLNGKYPPETELRFVKLVDTSMESNRWPGPDIDAIASLHGNPASADGMSKPAGDVASAIEFETSDGKKITLKMGNLSFVDEALGHDFGKKKPLENARNPEAAVGRPDYAGDESDADDTYFSLGDRGGAVWKFKDNSLINGPGDDLLIFEIGDYSEPMLVEISSTGDQWLRVGEVAGETCSIDIGPKTTPGAEFHYVRLTDIGNKGGRWPGADIDAIAAINGNIYFNPGVPSGTGKPAPNSNSNEKPGSGSTDGNTVPMAVGRPLNEGELRAVIYLDRIYAKRTVAEGGLPQVLQIRVQENGPDGIRKHQFPKGEKNRYFVKNGGTLKGENWAGFEYKGLSETVAADEALLATETTEMRSPKIETVLGAGEISTYFVFAAHSIWKSRSALTDDDRAHYGLRISDSWQPSNKVGVNGWDINLRNAVESELRQLEFGFGGQQHHVGGFALAVGNFDNKLELVCFEIAWQPKPGAKEVYPTYLRNSAGAFEARISGRTVEKGGIGDYQLLGQGAVRKLSFKADKGSFYLPQHVIGENLKARSENAENYFTVSIENAER